MFGSQGTIENLDAKPFKVQCEQSENIEGSRVNKVAGQMFQPVPCERNLKHQSDLKSTISIILLSNANRFCRVTKLENYFMIKLWYIEQVGDL